MAEERMCESGLHSMKAWSDRLKVESGPYRKILTYLLATDTQDKCLLSNGIRGRADRRPVENFSNVLLFTPLKIFFIAYNVLTPNP